MQVECVCGKWHNVSPTGMAVVIYAYTKGDLQNVGHTIESQCMVSAFTSENIIEFSRRYTKNDITVDGINYRLTRVPEEARKIA